MQVLSCASQLKTSKPLLKEFLYVYIYICVYSTIHGLLSCLNKPLIIVCTHEFFTTLLNNPNVSQTEFLFPRVVNE